MNFGKCGSSRQDKKEINKEKKKKELISVMKILCVIQTIEKKK